MGIIRNIDALDPSFRPIATELIQRLALAGIHYRIDETLRTEAVQKAYYLQSRLSLAEVNQARREAGLYLLTEAENKTTVTWTLDSVHLKGLAIDIVPLLANDAGKFFVPWDYERYADSWMAIGKISLELGLNWGGTWPPISMAGLGKDCPHHQLKA
jgi:hypothetical protein